GIVGLRGSSLLDRVGASRAPAGLAPAGVDRPDDRLGHDLMALTAEVDPVADEQPARVILAGGAEGLVGVGQPGVAVAGGGRSRRRSTQATSRLAQCRLSVSESPIVTTVIGRPASSFARTRDSGGPSGRYVPASRSTAGSIRISSTSKVSAG